MGRQLHSHNYDSGNEFVDGVQERDGPVAAALRRVPLFGDRGNVCLKWFVWYVFFVPPLLNDLQQWDKVVMRKLIEDIYWRTFQNTPLQFCTRGRGFQGGPIQDFAV